MKKLLYGLSLVLLGSLSTNIYSCVITFINDMSTPVHVILADGSDIKINAGEETTFGDSDALASFTVLKRVGSKMNKYRLTQESCSPSHQIEVYASAVGQTAIEYFKVSSNLNATASGGCGCGHKARDH